ncbi:MAG: copper amine oxidase N-terminal domain-containing protein [Syntrophomonas sp.]
MLRRRNKHFALLLVLAMLATMFAGVGTASAAGTVTSLTTPTISDSNNQTLGKIKVVIPAGTITSGDSVIVNLPSDYEFSTAVGKAAADSGTVNEVIVPVNNADGDPNGIAAADFAITGGAAGDDSFTITANATQSETNDVLIYIALDAIDATDASTGNAVVTLDGSENSGFPMGEVTVGKLSTDGDVTLSASSLDTSNDNFAFTLRIKESLAASFTTDSKSIKVKLPNGYEWTTVAAPAVTTKWGTARTIAASINSSGDTMTLVPNAVSADASCWEIPVSFQVEDESDCTAGDIEAAISGDSTIATNTLKVGTYGDYNATVKAGETVPTILSGFEEQEIADITVTESMEESLQDGRTITLQLPSGARWQEAIDGNGPENFATDNGLSTAASFTGTDDRTAKYILSGPSNDAAELKLEDVEVAVEPGFSGDLVVTVAGNAGVEGEITVAKVVTPVTVAVSAKTDVEIGEANQAVGDITITEAQASALAEGDLILRLPEGFKWSNNPTVKVESGNAKVDADTTKDDNDRNLVIDVTSDSTTASAIKVTGATVTVNRTVAEGEFKVSVKGDAALDDLYYDLNSDGDQDNNEDDIWPNSTTAASAVLGTIITAAGGDVTNTAVFTFGSTTYTLNGVEKTMDVAPYTKDNRTYMPIRYVAYALGIDDSNIIWDQVSSTVTLMKGDKVVQLKLGSKTLLANGAAITMDVAPEAVSNRIMLPAALVAQAFGATATWDATANTVTIK